MDVSLSVIICTYNPVDKVFRESLDALEKALELQPVLEILLIDNNSPVSLESRDYIMDFIRRQGNARIIHEMKQGLTPARLRGIKESAGELLVFIDDDNLVRQDFLKKAATIAEEYPFVGAYSGQVQLVPETTPPEWTRRYWGMLVHRLFKGNHWGNTLFNTDIMPCGAGMCVRRKVALYYDELHENGQRHIQLDRTDNSLLSGGDNDLAMCACDVEMGMGLFEDLYVYHHISSGRFTLPYLSKLIHGIYYSGSVLKFMRLGTIERLSSRQKLKITLLTAFKSSEDKAITRSWIKGLKDAEKALSHSK